MDAPVEVGVADELRGGTQLVDRGEDAPREHPRGEDEAEPCDEGGDGVDADRLAETPELRAEVVCDDVVREGPVPLDGQDRIEDVVMGR